MSKTFGPRARAVATVFVAAALVAACGSSSSSSSSGAATNAAATSGKGADAGKHLKLAYLSFAVANSYDAPMLASAQAVADSNNASITVFDANNDPNKQFAQLQDVLTSGGYDGVILQPIESTNLIPLAQQAISKHVGVANIDQILGPKLDTFQKQVPGQNVNVTFVPTDIGTKLGQLVVKACTERNLNPCNVGYLYDIKASALDVAIRDSFNKAIASTPSVKVVAQGQDFFTPSQGLSATQDMLQANPNLNLVVGSDQGIEGATQAVGKDKKVVLVGYGGSAAAQQGVASGAWFGDVAQNPATEGREGTQQLIQSIRNGTSPAAANALDDLPADGVMTKSNANEFHPEWPG
ncbi:MAG TPA: sugar ABC transporter substrate-binding protein [Solirubrobacteraceae bacterium]|nr:sugar ABC transporter substrate-binding protein [Solirubrobacteraceae bacterium]